MPNLSSSFAKANENNIKEWIHDGLTIHTDLTPMIFQITNQSGAIVRFHDSGGPKHLSASNPGATTPTIQKAKGFETVVAPQVFKSKMQLTREDKEDIQYDELTDDSRDLGEAVTQTVNTLGSETFILGFTPTAISYGDALPLYSVQHTNVLGGTAQSNADASGRTLTETNLETLFNAMRQQQSLGGKKLNVTAGNLVIQVPEALDKEASIIVDSNLRSATTDNDLNWYRGKYSVFVNPFIGSDWATIEGTAGSNTAFYLIAKGEAGIFFNYTNRPSFTMWEDEDTDSFFTKVYMRVVAGWKDWRGTHASQGDGEAYTG